ncbi:MAG: hypothetical protein Q8Q02_09935 [Nocardioides sp.]|nr:hypothetical protein [Nocardioides sp.]
MRQRLLVLPATVVATLALLVGCSSGDEPSAEEETPLATPQGEGEFVPPPSQPTDPLDIETYRVCVDLSDQPDELLVREEFLSPTDDVTIASVEAIGAQGLTLVDSWVTPAQRDQGGVIDSFPPTAIVLGEGYRWDDREEAGGATLEGGSSYHLFVHLSREQQASIDGVRIGYTSDGEDYETGTTNKYVFGGGC